MQLSFQTPLCVCFASVLRLKTSFASQIIFLAYTDSGTVLFAQRSGVVGIAEQAGIVSHDEGGEDIQKLLFFQIVVVTDTPGGKALVINLRKAHHTIAEVGHGMLFGVLLQ